MARRRCRSPARIRATPVPSGTGFVAIGTFTIGDGSITAANFANVVADFQQFGTATTFGGAGGFSIDGLFGHDASAPINAGSPLVTPTAQNIYLVAGNGTNLGNSNEVLIYRFPQTFGVDNPVFGESVRLTEQAPTFFAGLLIGGEVADVPVAGLGNVGGLHFVAVPEPAAPAILPLLGLGVLLRRKRR